MNSAVWPPLRPPAAPTTSIGVFHESAYLDHTGDDTGGSARLRVLRTGRNRDYTLYAGKQWGLAADQHGLGGHWRHRQHRAAAFERRVVVLVRPQWLLLD